MLQTESKIRVRYCDVDRMGYLHHGNYPAYLEVGRTDLIRKLGLSYREMEDRGVILPVRDMQIRYLKAIEYDDEVLVETRMEELPGVKLVFDYTINSANGNVHCEAKTTLVFVDASTRKPIRSPEFFTDLLKPYFG